jgi:hypothetical protein
MPYIDDTKAKQIVSIAKDYIGTTFYSYVSKSANGCGQKNDWRSLLCFYELYRVAGHNIDDLINDPTYQNIIVKLLSQVALTPNYSLATCNSSIIVTNGGCGCEGGSSTTGPVSGCTDSILPFHLNFGEVSFGSPFLIGVDILIVVREGIVMRANPAAIDGFIFDPVTGTFIPNAPVAEGGEDFIILYKNCSTGGVPVPPIGLATGSITFSGDGVTTSFSIPHLINSITPPLFYIVGAGSVAAQGWTDLDINTTHIIVNYDVGPPTGTNNIILTWAAR